MHKQVRIEKDKGHPCTHHRKPMYKVTIGKTLLGHIFYGRIEHFDRRRRWHLRSKNNDDGGFLTKDEAISELIKSNRTELKK